MPLFHLSSHTKQFKQVQEIIHIANQPPNIFNDLQRVTKVHIPPANATIQINFPLRNLLMRIEPNHTKKHSKLINSKDKNPLKKKT